MICCVLFERREKMKLTYTHTKVACYFGFVTQAIVNNFAPLLFITFTTEFDMTLSQITPLVSINFAVQLLVDLLCAKFADKLGYRACMVTAQICAAAGLAGLSFLPELFGSPFVGILIPMVLYAVGGGLLEVLCSPIVEALPSEHKEASMSVLHAFYSWGHLAVILFSTLFFSFAGIANWRYLACIWAVVPALNAVAFAKVPILRTVEEAKSMKVPELLRSGLFWMLIIVMLCAGASEMSMAQWVSAFTEAGLKVDKTLGDLAGGCIFAALMSVSRMLNAGLSRKFPRMGYMAVCGGLCVCGYLLAALSPTPVPAFIGCALCGLSCGVFWPGTFSLAARIYPAGGTALFAFLALAGDLGCSSGPGVVGLVSGIFGDRLQSGLLAVAVFPAVLVISVILLLRAEKRKT